MTTRLSGIALALALLVAACGGGDDAGSGVASLEDAAQTTSAADAAAVPPAEAEDALLAFAQCMREHGVDMEDPTVDADGNVALGFRAGGAGDGDFETVQAAREECQVHLESLRLGFRRGDDTDFQDSLLEFAQCMRDNGIEMDDPDLSTFGPGDAEDGEPSGPRRPFGELDPDDPQFEAAMEACGDVLPGVGRGQGGPPGAGGGGDG